MAAGAEGLKTSKPDVPGWSSTQLAAGFYVSDKCRVCITLAVSKSCGLTESLKLTELSMMLCTVYTCAVHHCHACRLNVMVTHRHSLPMMASHRVVRRQPPLQLGLSFRSSIIQLKCSESVVAAAITVAAVSTSALLDGSGPWDGCS